MFAELIYNKRSAERLTGTGEIVLVELTRRMHQAFPDAEAKVKPIQANALSSDTSKDDREKLNRTLEDMFEETGVWLVSKFPTVHQVGL